MTYLYDSLDGLQSLGHNGRVLVSYDRHGVTIQEWRETDEVEDGPFDYQEGWFAWPDVLKTARDSHGRLSHRIVDACTELLCSVGGSSDYCGPVPDTQTVISDYGQRRHW